MYPCGLNGHYDLVGLQAADWIVFIDGLYAGTIWYANLCWVVGLLGPARCDRCGLARMRHLRHVMPVGVCTDDDRSLLVYG